MLNPFVIKKWGALLLTGLVTTIVFYSALVFTGNLLIACGFMAAGLTISALISNLLLDNPFRAMIEGKGILALNIDSTGVIRPFIMNVRPPYIEGLLGQNLATDVYDREMVYNLAAPQEAGFLQQGEGKDGKVRMAMILSEEEYNKARFALFHFPVIIYNEQIRSLITKDFLSEQEKATFAEHGVLYLNRKMEELTSAIRDFGRYVVEQLKPNKFTISPTLIWIFIIIGIVGLAIWLLPQIFPGMQQAAGNLVEGTAGAVQRVGG